MNCIMYQSVPDQLAITASKDGTVTVWFGGDEFLRRDCSFTDPDSGVQVTLYSDDGEWWSNELRLIGSRYWVANHPLDTNSLVVVVYDIFLKVWGSTVRVW